MPLQRMLVCILPGLLEMGAFVYRLIFTEVAVVQGSRMGSAQFFIAGTQKKRL